MGEEEEKIPPPPPQQQQILIHATTDVIHVEYDDDDDIRPFPSNEWYVLKLNSTDGPKLSVTLDDAPLVAYSFSDDFLFTRGTTSALLGSYLYLITAHEDFKPGHIYRLDTLNPSTGWIKSVELPFSFENAAVFVDDATSSIYMFPVFSGFFPPNLDDNEGYCYWGYVYDAVEQKGYPIKKPSPNSPGFEWTQFQTMRNSIWAFWKEHDLVVAPRFPYNTVGVYNITEKSWSNWSTQFPPFPTTDKDGPAGCEPYTVIDGVLYLLDIECWLLYAYDLSNGSHQVVELRLDGYKHMWTNGIPRLVPLGDSKFCFIWYDGRRIACATYQISLHPSPLVAILLNKCSLAFGGGTIVNCMLFDSFRGPRAGETKGGGEEEEEDRLKRNGPNKCDDPVSKGNSKWLTEKILSPQVNSNVCGSRSIYSLASSAAAAAANNNNFSILAPSALMSQKYHTSVARIPSSASFFRASLASGISLLKKLLN